MKSSKESAKIINIPQVKNKSFVNKYFDLPVLAKIAINSAQIEHICLPSQSTCVTIIKPTAHISVLRKAELSGEFFLLSCFDKHLRQQNC